MVISANQTRQFHSIQAKPKKIKHRIELTQSKTLDNLRTDGKKTSLAFIIALKTGVQEKEKRKKNLYNLGGA